MKKQCNKLHKYRWYIDNGDGYWKDPNGNCSTVEIAKQHIQQCRAWNQDKHWVNNRAYIQPVHQAWWSSEWVSCGDVFDASA